MRRTAVLVQIRALQHGSASHATPQAPRGGLIRERFIRHPRVSLKR